MAASSWRFGFGLADSRSNFAGHRQVGGRPFPDSADVALWPVSVFPRPVFWRGWDRHSFDRLHRVRHHAQEQLRVHRVGFARACLHRYVFFMSVFPKPPPNPAGAVDAPIARLFAFDCRWRRATDQRRSAASHL